MLFRIVPCAPASGTTFPRPIGRTWRTPEIPAAALSLALIAFAPTVAQADVVGGACMTGAHTVSDGVVLKCVSSAWAATSIQLGNDSTTCAAGKAGAIRWNGTVLQYCNGSDWGAVGTLTSGSGFGSWSTSYSLNTTYQATSDGFVLAYLSVNSGGRCYMQGYTDSASAPTTARAAAAGQETGSNDRVLMNSLTMPVKNGDYWRVVYSAEAGSCATALTWISDTGGSSGGSTSAGGSNTQVQYNNGGSLAGAAAAAYATSGTHLTLTAQAAATKPIIVKGASSQSANLTEWHNSSGTELAVVTAAGNVAIGASTSNYKLTVVAPGGTAYVADGGVWVNASDRRLKEDIKPIEYGLDTVMQLNPVSYTLKATHEPQIGFIAQEVEDIIPELVGEIDTDRMDGQRTLSYDQMVAVAVKAIQQLSELNDVRSDEIMALKDRIEDLEEQIEAIQ